MKAYRDHKSELLEVKEADKDGNESRLLNSPLFKRFIGVFGWLDPKGADSYAENWLSIIGEQEDGEYSIFAEVLGSLPVIAEQATNWKDRLLVERYYISDENQEGVMGLRRHDGLTQYRHEGTNAFNKKKWIHKGDHWPYFRDRDTRASIIPVPTEIRTDIMAGYELLRELDAKGKFTIRWSCPKSRELITQGPPYDRIVEHPLMQAIIFGFVMLERTKPRDTAKKERRENPYSNLGG